MNIKKLTLFVSLFTLLLLGQGSAATISSVNVDGFNDGEAYGVDIYWVGTSSADQHEISPSTWGTYDYVSTSSIVTLVIKVNVTGYSMWENVHDAIDLPEGALLIMPTVGQLDLFVDGTTITVGTGYTGSTGAVVTLVGIGDHTVSMLYSNMDDDGTFHYAMDSITIRIRTTASFVAYETTTFTLDYDIADAAVAGEDISRLNSIVSDPWSRNVTLGVKVDATASATANTDGTRSIKITGTADTTGSRGDALVEMQKSTIGRIFIVDAAGVHLYDGSAMEVTVRATDPATSTYVGAYAQGDAGIFYDNTDHEEILGTSDNTGNAVDFWWSVDFWGALDGSSFGSLDVSESRVTSIETTTTTEDTPGFSGFEALLGLLSLGTIAFLIPRKFRK